MKLAYILIGILILGGFTYLVAKNNLTNKDSLNQNFKSQFNSNKVKRSKMIDNPYVRLRNIAVKITPEDLNLQVENDELFGIIMDWNMEHTTLTLVSFITNDVSIYLESGQIIIGGYAHQTVVDASDKFLSIGNKYLSKAVKTNNINPNKDKFVNFYFLTKSGKYYIEEDFESIENGESDIYELFGAANKVITEFRIIEEGN